MAKIRFYRSGVTLSPARGRKSADMSEAQKHNRRRNGVWTANATRGLTTFLMALDFSAVGKEQHALGDGFGVIAAYPYAVTLTIPSEAMDTLTPERFHGLLHRWTDSMKRRYGLRHYVWLIEFTAARTVHIHATVWLDSHVIVYDRVGRVHRLVPNSIEVGENKVHFLGPLAAWLELLRFDGISGLLTAQDIKRINDTPQFWLEYTAKHSTRGVQHYQRQADGLVPAWREHPGAMWGHDRGLAAFSTAPRDVQLTMEGFYKMRRVLHHLMIVKAMGIVDQRKRGKAIAMARRALKTQLSPEDLAKKKRMRARGVDWCPPPGFHGLRQWLEPDVQQQVLDTFLTGAYAGDTSISHIDFDNDDYETKDEL